MLSLVSFTNIHLAMMYSVKFSKYNDSVYFYLLVCTDCPFKFFIVNPTFVICDYDLFPLVKLKVDLIALEFFRAFFFKLISNINDYLLKKCIVCNYQSMVNLIFAVCHCNSFVLSNVKKLF